MVYAEGAAPELNLGFTREDDPAAVDANRHRAAEAVGGTGARLATVRQVHGTSVLMVKGAGPAGDADGLMTATPGLVLGIMVADCAPILVADVRRRIVGAFHAGWRGTAAGMAGVGVRRMIEQGARLKDMVAAVGPSIGPCCYEVGEEVRGGFAVGAEGVFQARTLDLWESNRRQLLAAGIAKDRVTAVGECTACTRLGDGRRKYFSHRAENGFTGRAMGMIGIAAVE